MCLERGDVVDIVAPGSACSEQELRNGASFIESWGLVPRFPKNIFRKKDYLSNTDGQRFAFLREALLSSSSKAIWCVRGGYGSMRLLPFLQRMKRPEKNKLFIGLSDITSLHLFLNQVWGWQTVHGPLLERMASGRYTPQVDKDLKNILFRHPGKKTERVLSYRGLKSLNEMAKIEKVIRGPVIGGNLVVASSTLGTPWQMNVEGKIVFFEEIDERGYRVDRLLQQWLQTQSLKRAKAIVFGEFIGGEESDGRRLWKGAIKSFAQDLKKPVLSGFPSGHGKIQRPIIFGSTSCLHLGLRPFMETKIKLDGKSS